LKINALTQDYDDNKDQFMKMVSSEGKMNALKSISAADQKLTSSSSVNNNVISIDQSILKVDPYSKDALDMIGSRTKSTPVNFSVQYETKWGENLFVLGSHKKLGAWDEAKAIPMHYKEGGHWSCEVDLQPGGIFFLQISRAFDIWDEVARRGEQLARVARSERFTEKRDVFSRGLLQRRPDAVDENEPNVVGRQVDRDAKGEGFVREGVIEATTNDKVRVGRVINRERRVGIGADATGPSDRGRTLVRRRYDDDHHHHHKQRH